MVVKTQRGTLRGTEGRGRLQPRSIAVLALAAALGALSLGGWAGCVLGRDGLGPAATSAPSGGAGGSVGDGGSGAVGGGGGGVLPECDVPEDCPGQDEPCHYRYCALGQCSFQTPPAGVPCGEGAGDECDGAGKCLKGLGRPCTTPEECLSGYCADTVCCSSESCGSATDCSACNVLGSEGECSDVPAGTECDDGAYCNGADQCDSSGECTTHGLDPCGSTDDDDCVGACDESADSCTADEPDGSACDDWVYCDGSDSCSGGYCTPSWVDPCAGNLTDCDNDCSESCNESAHNCTANDPPGTPCRVNSNCNDQCDGQGACY